MKGFSHSSKGSLTRYQRLKARHFGQRLRNVKIEVLLHTLAASLAQFEVKTLATN